MNEPPTVDTLLLLEAGPSKMRGGEFVVYNGKDIDTLALIQEIGNLYDGDVYRREDDQTHWVYFGGWHGPFNERRQAITAARLLV